MGERKFLQMVLVTWQRWSPCPYIHVVKTLKTLLLRNQKADDLETVCPCPGAIYMYKIMIKIYKFRLWRDFFLNLQQITEVTRCSCWHQNFVPKGLWAPAPGLYTCIESWKNWDNSGIVLRKVGILTLSDEVGILTLRSAIPELLVRKVGIGTKWEYVWSH